MVALMCQCCQEKYFPDLTFVRLGLNEGSATFSGVPFFSYSFRFYIGSEKISPRFGLCPFVLVDTVFHLEKSKFTGDYVTRRFPLSVHDYIEISILKPDYFGVDWREFAGGAGFEKSFEVIRILHSDFNDLDFYLNLIMERFNPFFSTLYFYYSSTREQYTNNYAKLYTYDEFVSAVRAKFNEIFTYFKSGCLSDYNSSLFSYGSFFRYMIEKEPK